MFYNYIPTKVNDNDRVIIIWNMPDQLDNEIKVSGISINVKDWTNNNCLLVDIPTTSDQNIVKK